MELLRDVLVPLLLVVLRPPCHHLVHLYVLLNFREILLQFVRLLRGGIVDDRFKKCPLRGSWRFIKRRIASMPLPSLTEWQIREGSSSVHDSKMEYKLKSELQHVLLVVRVLLIHVTLGNYRIRPSRPLDQLVRLRQIGHQLSLPLRVLAQKGNMTKINYGASWDLETRICKS